MQKIFIKNYKCVFQKCRKYNKESKKTFNLLADTGVSHNLLMNVSFAPLFSKTHEHSKRCSTTTSRDTYNDTNKSTTLPI